MKISDHPIRDGAISTVLGGVALAILGKLYGFMPQLWNGVAWVIGRIGKAASRPITLSLPVWGWLCLVAVTYVLTRWIKASRAHESNVPLKEAVPTPDPPLDALEAGIMRIFAAAGGSALPMQELVIQLRTNNLRASKALESLETRGLVGAQHNIMDGTRFQITRAGRDYLLDQNLA